MKKYLTIFIFALATYSNQSLAGTIEGKITFTKKGPFAGVLYVVTGKHQKLDIQVDQKNKQFVSKLSAGSVPGKITFRNSDNMDHNVFASDLKNNVRFDVGLMSPGGESEVPMTWKENTLVRIGCKIHPKMRSYIANIPSAHYQIFEFSKGQKEYDIKIENVPRSAKELWLLMPKYPPLKLTLDGDGKASTNIIKKNKIKGTIDVNRI